MTVFLMNSATEVMTFWMAATDHLTGATGQSPTVRFSKNGATAFSTATQAVTEMQFGWYKLTLATNNTDTKGELAVHATATKADDTDEKHFVGPTPANAIWWASATIPAPTQTGRPLVDLTHIHGATATTGAAHFGVNVFSWATATGTVPAPNQPGRPMVDLTHIHGATATTGTAHFGVRTVSIAGQAITATTFATGAIANAALEDDAISASKVAADTIGSSQIATAGAQEIARFVWDEGMATHVATGTAGDFLTRIDATVSSRSTATQGPTAAVIADAVWDEVLSGHLGTGSAGDALTTAAAAGTDPWTRTIPGTYTATQAGGIVGTNLDTTVSSRATAGVTAIADGVWTRDMASITRPAGVRYPLQGVDQLRNKWALASTGVLTVYQQDDSTVSWTATATGDSAAIPVTGIDP